MQIQGLRDLHLGDEMDWPGRNEFLKSMDTGVCLLRKLRREQALVESHLWRPLRAPYADPARPFRHYS
jgi:hypothetical protein